LINNKNFADEEAETPDRKVLQGVGVAELDTEGMEGLDSNVRELSALF
jgi:hypothetical protein